MCIGAQKLETSASAHSIYIVKLAEYFDIWKLFDCKLGRKYQALRDEIKHQEGVSRNGSKVIKDSSC
jgi:hypothetical protein